MNFKSGSNHDFRMHAALALCALLPIMAGCGTSDYLKASDESLKKAQWSGMFVALQPTYDQIEGTGLTIRRPKELIKAQEALAEEENVRADLAIPLELRSLLQQYKPSTTSVVGLREVKAESGAKISFPIQLAYWVFDPKKAPTLEKAVLKSITDARVQTKETFQEKNVTLAPIAGRTKSDESLSARLLKVPNVKGFYRKESNDEHPVRQNQLTGELHVWIVDLVQYRVMVTLRYCDQLKTPLDEDTRKLLSTEMESLGATIVGALTVDPELLEKEKEAEKAKGKAGKAKAA